MKLKSRFPFQLTVDTKKYVASSALTNNLKQFSSIVSFSIYKNKKRISNIYFLYSVLYFICFCLGILFIREY